MKKTSIAFTGFAAAAVLLVAKASAATLVSYDFDGAVLLAPTSQMFVTATNIVDVGTPTGFGTTVAETNLTPPVTGFTSTGMLSMGTAAGIQYTKEYQTTSPNISLTTYLGFTLTPQAGGVDLQTIALDFAKGGDSLTRGFVVRYSFNSFASFSTAGSGSVTATYTGVESDFLRHTFTLADQGPLPDTTTSPVEFRIYGFAGSGRQIRFDNIVVTGAAVPEPTTVAMLLGGFGTLLMLRRRRS